MHRTYRLVLACLGLVALCAAPPALVTTAAVAAEYGAPGVLPPQSMPYGHSYGEWSVKWWQWAYGLPVAGHPLFDETGAYCGVGQSGPVWFLGGVFNVSGTVVRTECVVPTGKALFFPIVNVEWDNFCPPDDLTLEELRATAASFMDLATDLQCEIDGRPVAGLEQFRFVADPFGVDIPSGSIWEFFGCATPAGHYEPLVPDGFFVMVTPLRPGHHTIHFRGTIGDPVNFTPEATYELTVLPKGQWMSLGLPGHVFDDSAPDQVTDLPRTSWGRVKAIYR